MFPQRQGSFAYIPPPQDEWEVPRSRVLFKEEIGAGQYGRVFKGVVTGGIREFSNRVTVALKQSHLEISLTDVKAFFSEVEVMKKFSNPHHRNVRFSVILKGRSNSLSCFGCARSPSSRRIPSDGDSRSGALSA